MSIPNKLVYLIIWYACGIRIMRKEKQLINDEVFNPSEETRKSPIINLRYL